MVSKLRKIGSSNLSQLTFAQQCLLKQKMMIKVETTHEQLRDLKREHQEVDEDLIMIKEDVVQTFKQDRLKEARFYCIATLASQLFA